MVREVFKHQLHISTFESYSELPLGWSAKILVLGESFEWFCRFAKLWVFYRSQENSSLKGQQEVVQAPWSRSSHEIISGYSGLHPVESWKPSEMKSAQPHWRAGLHPSSVITASWVLVSYCWVSLKSLLLHTEQAQFLQPPLTQQVFQPCDQLAGLHWTHDSW